MEDLQSLLEKINRDGVEKAEAEAQRILDAAKQQAAGIVAAAKESAAAEKAAAEREAAAFAARAGETVAQAARDTVLRVEGAVTALLEGILKQNVNAALGDAQTVTKLVAGALVELAGPGEVTCGAALAQALTQELAGKSAFTVVTDEATGAGFSVKLDGGRVEHDFKGATVAAELAKRLRPELAKLVTRDAH